MPALTSPSRSIASASVNPDIIAQPPPCPRNGGWPLAASPTSVPPPFDPSFSRHRAIAELAYRAAPAQQIEAVADRRIDPVRTDDQIGRDRTAIGEFKTPARSGADGAGVECDLAAGVEQRIVKRRQQGFARWHIE